MDILIIYIYIYIYNIMCASSNKFSYKNYMVESISKKVIR